MSVNVFIRPEDQTQAREILDWLRRETELRGVAELKLLSPAPASDDRMLGGSVDTVLATLSNPAVLSALTTTLGVWLGQRVRRTRIHVSDGERVVEIETTSRRRAEEYAATMLAQLQAEASESDPETPTRLPARPPSKPPGILLRGGFA